MKGVRAQVMLRGIDHRTRPGAAKRTKLLVLNVLRGHSWQRDAPTPAATGPIGRGLLWFVGRTTMRKSLIAATALVAFAVAGCGGGGGVTGSVGWVLLLLAGVRRVG
jgi:hypothetical protein